MCLGFKIFGREDEMLWDDGKLVQNQPMGRWQLRYEQGGRRALEGIEGLCVRLYWLGWLRFLSKGRRIAELKLTGD
ncbi:hypothetical protein RRF57_012346 [Xylaria bambusicola]|uniref:Uncharacterized protein n=1 Tax=Xylaria bambusicola TaxID=326684 RepID=A0AAN7V5I7_9PEZI